jgi:hypothetical protein
VLSVADAKSIAAQWRDHFQDQAAFEVSWSRYFEMVGDPRPDGLEQWLAKDAAKDAVKHAGIVSEPLLPVRQNLDVDASSCAICHGKRFVRHDVDIDHADFGKVFHCPRCGGR